MKSWFAVVVIVTAATTASVSAHIMVSPPESKAGAVQKYELRVHNEGKVAATGVDLDVPDGVTVTEIGEAPEGTVTTKKTGDRIVTISWKVDVPPSKYLALPFTAQNPAAAKEVHWNVHEHLANGTMVEWSDKAGAAEKASITKIQ